MGNIPLCLNNHAYPSDGLTHFCQTPDETVCVTFFSILLSLSLSLIFLCAVWPNSHAAQWLFVFFSPCGYENYIVSTSMGCVGLAHTLLQHAHVHTRLPSHISFTSSFLSCNRSTIILYQNVYFILNVLLWCKHFQHTHGLLAVTAKKAAQHLSSQGMTCKSNRKPRQVLYWYNISISIFIC